VIIVKVTGGLGNQLFQYAFGRYLAITNDTELWIDARVGQIRKNFDLSRFNTRFERQFDDDRSYEDAISSLSVDLKYLRESDCGLTFEQWKQIEGLGDNLLLDGYWSFFKDHLFDGAFQQTLKRELTLKYEIRQPLFQEFKEKIFRSPGSVGVHVRRGDYCDHQDIVVLLGEDYYDRAFDVIERKISTPEYFVFSDEIDWVKENFKFARNVQFVKTDTHLSDFELMRRCRHDITANSTFSWWAAYLNENNDKTIMVPARYHNNEFYKALYDISTPIFPIYDSSMPVLPMWLKI
jgi:hypothetical protein